MHKSIVCITFLLITQTSFAVDPTDLTETRYNNVAPARYADGTIKRSQKVIDAFKKIHPCPPVQLGLVCSDVWQINHAIPLACGGKDAVSNMYWAPIAIKTCKENYCIDRFERKIYGIGIPGTEVACPPYLIK